jgi:hypothetical protein
MSFFAEGPSRERAKTREHKKKTPSGNAKPAGARKSIDLPRASSQTISLSLFVSEETRDGLTIERRLSGHRRAGDKPLEQRELHGTASIRPELKISIQTATQK